MKQRNKPSAEPHVPVLVEFTHHGDSKPKPFWLVVQGDG